MNVYLNQQLFDALRWQAAGKLSYAESPFGLLIHNSSGNRWIVIKGALRELVEESGQLLVHYPTERLTVELLPVKLNFVDRLINWLQFNQAETGSIAATGALLTSINVEKQRLLESFDEGDITTDEFLTGLDSLHTNEVSALLARERTQDLLQNAPRRRQRILWASVCLFCAALLFSSFIYPMLFGFSNAEQCVLAKGGSREIVVACYELYPSVSDLRNKTDE